MAGLVDVSGVLHLKQVISLSISEGLWEFLRRFRGGWL